MKSNEILIILVLILASISTLIFGILQFKTAINRKSLIRYIFAVLLLLLFVFTLISLLKFTTPEGVRLSIELMSLNL